MESICHGGSTRVARHSQGDTIMQLHNTHTHTHTIGMHFHPSQPEFGTTIPGSDGPYAAPTLHQCSIPRASCAHYTPTTRRCRSKIWRDAMREKLAKVDGTRLEPADRARFDELRGWLHEDLYEPPWCVAWPCRVLLCLATRSLHIHNRRRTVIIASHTGSPCSRYINNYTLSALAWARSSCPLGPPTVYGANSNTRHPSAPPLTCSLNIARCTRAQPQVGARVGHGVLRQHINFYLYRPRRRCRRAGYIHAQQPFRRPSAGQSRCQPLGRPNEIRLSRHAQLSIRGCSAETEIA
jgi:hypothetical protein